MVLKEGLVLRVQGDAKDKLLAYAEEHPLDILVIGRSMGSRLRKVPHLPQLLIRNEYLIPYSSTVLCIKSRSKSECQ